MSLNSIPSLVVQFPEDFGLLLAKTPEREEACKLSSSNKEEAVDLGYEKANQLGIECLQKLSLKEGLERQALNNYYITADYNENVYPVIRSCIWAVLQARSPEDKWASAIKKIASSKLKEKLEEGLEAIANWSLISILRGDE